MFARVSAFLFLLLLLAPSALAEYRSYDLESLRITIDSDWARQGAQGYLPVRLDITNLGEAREIVLSISQQHWFDLSRGRPRSVMSLGSFDMGGIDTRQTIRLKRGDHVKLTVPIPVFADNENFQFRLLEKGRPIAGFVAASSFQSARPASDSAVLFVTKPSTPLGSITTPRETPFVRSYSPSFPGPGGRGIIVGGISRGRIPSVGGPPLDFYLDPERLPTNWLGYTMLLGVLIAEPEWKQLTPAQQDALLTWTAAGGELLLVDTPAETVLPSGHRAIGFSQRRTMLPYFLGRIHLLTSQSIQQQGWESVLTDTVVPAANANYSLPANRSAFWGVIGDRGFLLPIPGIGEVPTRAYLLILVLFILVIGPVNYIYLWRKRRQVLLVLTVPLLSAAFIALLSGYALFLQGLDVRARAMTLTVLDQGSKRAATRSTVSLYPGGFMPNGGLQFAGDTAVFPLGTDGQGQRTRMAIDLTNNQGFRTGLLTSRAPTNFEQVRIQPARERLSFERTGTELHVVNGLGSTIQQLFYRDGEQWWSLVNLAPGQKGSLTTTDEKARSLAGSSVNTVANVRFQEVATFQPDHTYLAVLDTSPFWEPGVTQPKESESLHLVLGYPDAQP
jgi:hypothetical protein